MPKASHLGGYDPVALLYIAILFAAALFVPALIARFVFSPESSDSDSDEDGGGGGPRRPPTMPNPQPGGLPLNDAKPAPVRLRDDRRLAQRLPARQRRSAREPARRPVRRSPPR
jgi:hypothetical protein